MANRVLNITNGDAFNRYFISNFGGEAIPFREAMMDGKSIIDIFSNEFIDARSSEFNVSAKEYRSNMLVYDALQNNNYDELCLWFGGDTFCQMNLLTLLAYLEQIDYRGKITLNYIDDETFEVTTANIQVELGIYKNLYEQILINKNKIDSLGILVPETIDLFFDYHSESGALAEMVRNNLDMEHTDLICRLLYNSKEYGLSDIQAKRLIEKYK